MDDINNRTPEESKENIEEKPIERAQERETEELEVRKVSEENVEKEIRELEESILELEPEILKATEGKAKEIKSLDGDKKVEMLLLLMREKGARYAVGVAKNLEDPYLMDRFHDLASKILYEKLEK